MLRYKLLCLSLLFIFALSAGCARAKWTRYYNFESDYSVDLPNSWHEDVMSPDLMQEQKGVQFFKEMKSNQPTGAWILIANWRRSYILKHLLENLKSEREPLASGVLNTDIIKGEWFTVAGEQEGYNELHYVFAWERGDILQVKCVIPPGASIDDYQPVFDEIVQTFMIR